MPRVLGVHGIAQQYRSGPELKRGWLDALRGGLKVAGFCVTADGLYQAEVGYGSPHGGRKGPGCQGAQEARSQPQDDWSKSRHDLVRPYDKEDAGLSERPQRQCCASGVALDDLWGKRSVVQDHVGWIRRPHDGEHQGDVPAL
jgi:hypothetical protein